jgi:cation diffusion facilitator CzcD-associated flavoprotein CzcO
VDTDGRISPGILADRRRFLCRIQGISLVNTNNTNKIAIIGAGVAGLCTARQLIREGFDCTLFERNEVLGGVWSDGYLNFGAQVQRELYEFPDWPLPEGAPISLLVQLFRSISMTMLTSMELFQEFVSIRR